MNENSYQTRAEYLATPEGRQAKRDSDAARTDRQVLNAIEARSIRIETRVSQLLVHLGMNADGTPKEDVGSASRVDRAFLTTPAH